MKKGVIILLGILIVVGTLFISKLIKEKNPQQISEEMVEVKSGDIKLSICEKGILEPAVKVNLTSNLKGVVKQILVKEGDFVKMGQMIVQLDIPELLNEMRKIEKEVSKAKINLQDAEEDLSRNKELFEKGFIAQKEVRKSEISYQLANLDLEQKKEDYKKCKMELEKTNILSPITGIVIEKNIEKGELWLADTSLNSQFRPYLTIADLNKWILKVKVSEIDVNKLSIGKKTNIKVNAYPGKNYDGEIINISPSAEDIRGMKAFEVIIKLDEIHSELKPYLSALVEIVTDMAKDVLYLPVESVFRRDNNKKIVLIKDGLEWKEIEVETGISNEEVIEIKKGLKKGDRVGLIDYIEKKSFHLEEKW